MVFKPQAPGKYENTLPFNKLRCTKFVPHLFLDSVSTGMGCGRCTLALLTGDDPITEMKGVPYSSVSDKIMVAYLKRRGIIVLPITRADVTQIPNVIMNHIGKQHVILASQLVSKNEATWTVIVGDVQFHNFTVLDVKPLDFINRPLLSAYCLMSPKWV